jgi:hypothetical protein
MRSYLFTHIGLNRRKRNPQDEYWKGLVTEIKTLTSASGPDALVKVRWFWSKKDIASTIKGVKVDPKLKR